ncbi:MAG TPA: DUF4214 domain-containing protein, partial [Iamia sp.]|nr:DUF4214 domain-containing protein [Iamia sp.]
DDISYFAEAAFQDDDVAQAITAVRADGAIYFTAAGNSGNLADGTSGTWQGDFQDAGASADPLPEGLRVHGWGVGQATNPVTEGFAQVVTLQWADPLGASGNDYDLYVLDETGTEVEFSSTSYQSGTEDPLETTLAFADEQLVVAKDAAAEDRYLAVHTNRGALTYATGGATYGHNASVDAISTGATPAAQAFEFIPGSPTGPFPEQHSAADASELFTSDGPVRSFYAPDGTPLTPGDLSSTGGVVRNGVDITAADGATTTTPGFAPFFGTSAAAPNAAAVAALALSGDPTLTPAELEAAMTSTAIDVEAEGVDPATGAGIVMAPATIAAAGLTDDAFVTFGDRTITEVDGDGDEAYEPGEVYDVAQTVRNDGVATATGVAAVLVPGSPDVTVVAGIPLPTTLAPNAEGVATARVRISLDCECGTRPSLTWTVTYGGGGPGTTSTAVELFVAGGLAAPQDIAYDGPEVPIPDGDPAGAAVEIEVGDVGRVGAVTLTIGGSACSTDAESTTVGLSHAFVSDLTLVLVSPDGTAVTLVARRGGGGNNLCQTVFSDAGAKPIAAVTAAGAPFTGTFRPEEPLSGLGGEHAEGTWTLLAVDSEHPDPGIIRDVALTVSPLACDQYRSTDAFVDAAFRDFLGRPAEPDALAFWGDRLLSGLETRATVARKVARSAEYAGIVTRRAYRQYLGRSGGAAEVAYWSERVRTGLSVSELPIHLLGSAELFTRSGGTSGGFVHDLFDAVLHRRPTATERAERVAALGRGTTRATVARALHAGIESRRLRTANQYDLLLGRAPTTAERDLWVRRLATQDDRDLAVALAATDEYLAHAGT